MDLNYLPIAVEGYILGWSKLTNKEVIKNIYPAGWIKQ